MQYKLVNKEIDKNYGAELLHCRGIDNVSLFLKPTPECLQSWKDLENIEKGIEILEKYLRDESPFAIIVDCDCDGACSFTILYDYLKRLNPEKKIDYFIHSGKQHGLEDQMDNLEDQGYSVIWCPDSGTNDGNYVARLSSSFVICLDHHIKEDSSIIPPNMIIINNQTSPNYKNKFLCGGAVTWQFCRALDFHFGKSWANDYMDLVATSLVGDMMSVLNYENQYLIQEGFATIRNKMLRALIDKQDFSMGGIVSPMTVAFYIVPLINAMIRVGSMDEKYRLYEAFIDGDKLVESHKRGANGAEERLCIESARECVNAKAMQDRTKERVTDSLIGRIYEKGLLENAVLFVRLEDEDDFPSELNGLIAMSLSAKFHKPTIVARLCNDGYDKGSARSPDIPGYGGFKEYLSSLGYFAYTLGHSGAFGCSIFDKNLQKFHEQANNDLAGIDFGNSSYDVNFIRRGSDKDIADLIFDLAQFSNCFGQDNSEPLIAVHSILVATNNIKIIGKNKDTVRFDYNGVTYIKFHAKDLISELENFDSFVEFEIVGKPVLNVFGGRATPQIQIMDENLKDGTLSF